MVGKLFATISKCAHLFAKKHFSDITKRTNKHLCSLFLVLNSTSQCKAYSPMGSSRAVICFVSCILLALVVPVFCQNIGAEYSEYMFCLCCVEKKYCILFGCLRGEGRRPKPSPKLLPPLMEPAGFSLKNLLFSVQSITIESQFTVILLFKKLSSLLIMFFLPQVGVFSGATFQLQVPASLLPQLHLAME